MRDLGAAGAGARGAAARALEFRDGARAGAGAREATSSPERPSSLGASLLIFSGVTNSAVLIDGRPRLPAFRARMDPGMSLDPWTPVERSTSSTLVLRARQSLTTAKLEKLEKSKSSREVFIIITAHPQLAARSRPEREIEPRAARRASGCFAFGCQSFGSLSVRTLLSAPLPASAALCPRAGLLPSPPYPAQPAARASRRSRLGVAPATSDEGRL